MHSLMAALVKAKVLGFIKKNMADAQQIQPNQPTTPTTVTSIWGSDHVLNLLSSIRFHPVLTNLQGKGNHSLSEEEK